MGQVLAGRTAVVTGASRGIGAETARMLAAEGAVVTLVARSTAPLEALAQQIGGGAWAVTCDLGDARQAQDAAKRIGERVGGAPDILVNNAGVFRVSPVEATPLEMFTSSIAINLIAPFVFLRAFVGAMRRRGSGHVITIGSVADRTAFPENAAYSASKYGLRAVHEVLRVELRDSGVRTTLVSPGAVDTDLWNELPVGSSKRSAPSRMIAAQDVAAAVLFAVTRPATVNIDELRLART